MNIITMSHEMKINNSFLKFILFILLFLGCTKEADRSMEDKVFLLKNSGLENYISAKKINIYSNLRKSVLVGKVKLTKEEFDNIFNSKFFNWWSNNQFSEAYKTTFYAMSVPDEFLPKSRDNYYEIYMDCGGFIRHYILYPNVNNEMYLYYIYFEKP